MQFQPPAENARLRADIFWSKSAPSTFVNPVDVKADDWIFTSLGPTFYYALKSHLQLTFGCPLLDP